MAWKHSLSSHVGSLGRTPEAEAVKDLVADPLADGGIETEGVEETGADCCDADAEDQEGCVVANARCEDAGEDGCDDDGEDHG